MSLPRGGELDPGYPPFVDRDIRDPKLRELVRAWYRGELPISQPDPEEQPLPGETFNAYIKRQEQRYKGKKR